MISWSYDPGDGLEPTEFHVDVFGQTVGTVAYTGPGDYELEVTSAVCGQANYAMVVAVAGESTGSSDVVEVQTKAC